MSNTPEISPNLSNPEQLHRERELSSAGEEPGQLHPPDDLDADVNDLMTLLNIHRPGIYIRLTPRKPLEQYSDNEIEIVGEAIKRSFRLLRQQPNYNAPEAEPVIPETTDNRNIQL